MILAIFLLFISVFLESIIPNLIREFIPFFMIAAIIIISSFKIEDKKVYTTIFIFGVCYDLLYTNLIIFHGFLFILLFYICKIILKNSKNFFFMIFTYYLLIAIYCLIMFLFTMIYSNTNYIYLFIIIFKSLFINSIYFIITYVLFIGINCLIRNRNKKRSY